MIVAGAATLIPTPTTEPNESAEQAFGPLLGGVSYTGEIQTENDQDWFKFYTAPGIHQFDVAMTRISGCETTIELQSPVKNETRHAYPPTDEWRHFTETSQAAGIYYLKVTGRTSVLEGTQRPFHARRAGSTTVGDSSSRMESCSMATFQLPSETLVVVRPEVRHHCS
jgi:hypothetical protein